MTRTIDFEEAKRRYSAPPTGDDEGPRPFAPMDYEPALSQVTITAKPFVYRDPSTV